MILVLRSWKIQVLNKLKVPGNVVCKISGSLMLLIVCFSSIQAQVATYYNFSQATGTYVPATSGFIDTTGAATSTPASIFVTSWDDKTAIFRLPFDFTYNGVLYPASTGRIGLDSDAWFTFSNGNPVMTGQLGGGSWVSTSDHSGVYLFGTANNNGFAGFNCDLNDQSFSTFTGTRTAGSPVITSVSSTANLQIGTRLVGTGITDGTIVTGISGTNVTMSANATSTSSTAVTPRSSIIAFITGTAPNRSFIIQWTQAKRYSGGTTDNINFQMLINEAGGVPNLQTLQVKYGPSSTTDLNYLNTQVGLRGTSAADFNARSSTAGWAATSVAAANTDIVRFNNTTVPASGLTFTWSPCTAAPGAAGAISGANPACASSVVTYSIAPVAGATTYTWVYTGTGATFSGTTTSPSNAITFGAGATAGTLTVTPSNICGIGIASGISITINPSSTASISYPSSSYCISTPGLIPVTQTGTGGGTYSISPASGLTINGSGGITPSTSTAGTYIVTYTFTNGTCSNSTSTTVVINPGPSVTATSSPSSLCSGGNAQLQASVAISAGYTLSNISYTSLTPSGSPTVLWSTAYTDDANSAAIPMPFAFNYYGAAITQFFVNTNGHIQLQTGVTPGNAEQLIPNATTPNNVIALCWDDLVVDNATNPGNYVRYFTNGTGPNRILVVEYSYLRFLGGTGAQNISGQIRLYESDGHIEVAVANVNDNGASRTKTLGIENSDGTAGLSPSGRNLAVWNVSNEAWAFTPISSGPYTYAWSPATYLNSTTISNPVAAAVAATTNYTVTVTNTANGCSTNTNTTVTVNGNLNGTYTVGLGGNYTTLTSAVAAYNTQCITGPVTFSLIDDSYPTESYPIVINSNAFASAVNTLTIKPAASKNPVITGSNAVAILKLNGADYVTIDGSNTVGGTTRNLSFINTSTNSTTSTIIWLASTSAANGAGNNNIRNCLFTGNAPTTTFSALISSGSVVGEIAEAANNNNTFVNNRIIRAQTAIAVVGATGNESGTIISGNEIGSVTAGDKLGLSGIELYQQAGAQVINNIIYGVTSSSSSTASGISVFGTASGVTISGNKVSAVKNTSSSGWGSNGIYLGSSSTNANVNVFNNVVFDVASYGYTGGRDENDNGYGIIVDYGGGYNIYYNTVHLNTSQTVSGYPACINVTSLVTTAGSVNIKNNIFSNVQTVGERYAIQSSAANTVFGTINYNDYYTSGANIGYIGGTNRAVLANIQAGFGQNLNSISYLPVYTSSTDYHIIGSDAGNIANLENKGNPVTGITEDFDVQTRNGYTPDLGADEWVKPNYGSWVGKVSVDWLVPANWEANFVPDGTTDVFVTGGYTYMPTIVTTQAVRNLSLSSPGTAPIITLSAGTLQVNGLITRTGGSINGSNGTVEMNNTGAVAQVIPADLFQNNNLKNLVIGNNNNVTGVTLGGPLDIYRSLTFSGTGLRLTTGGYLTLKSTATETAWLGNMTGKTLTGAATVERYVPIHSKAWQLLSTPITASSTQTVKQAWQDSATVANQNRYGGYGTMLTSNRAGAASQPTPGFDLYTPAGPSVKVYNRLTGGYTGLNRTDTAISNPKGYMLFVRGDRSVTTLGAPVTATVMRMKGTLHTPANPPVTINLATPGFESVGNPYASAINFRQLSFTGGVQTDFFYLWDPKLTTGPTSAWGLGGFQTFSWNGSTFDVTPGGGSYTGANRNIESGQAFFINAPFSSGTLGFSESSKVSGSANVFRVMPVNVSQLRTNLNVINDTEKVLLDGNLVKFDRAWSNTVDIHDGIKLGFASENLGLIRDGKSLAVECRKPVNKNDTIYYRMAGLKVHSYELEFVPRLMQQPGLEAYLEDRFLGTSTPVSLRDTTRHVFSITPDAASADTGRFYLVFRKVRNTGENKTEKNPPVSGISAKPGAIQSRDENSGMIIYPNPVAGNILQVQLLNQLPGEYDLQLFNSAGHIVFKSRFFHSGKNEIVPVQTGKLMARGAYQLKIFSKEGKSLIREVVFQ